MALLATLSLHVVCRHTPPLPPLPPPLPPDHPPAPHPLIPPLPLHALSLDPHLPAPAPAPALPTPLPPAPPPLLPPLHIPPAASVYTLFGSVYINIKKI